MELAQKNNDYFYVKVYSCVEIDPDKKTGRRLFQVLYYQKVFNKKHNREVDVNKSTKSYIDIKPSLKDQHYKVEAETTHIPEAYEFNGKLRAKDNEFYRITKILEVIKEKETEGK